jgi:hypothetical protein
MLALSHGVSLTLHPQSQGPGEVGPPGSGVVRAAVYRKRRGNCLMIPVLRASAIMRMWLWILSRRRRRTCTNAIDGLAERQVKWPFVIRRIAFCDQLEPGNRGAGTPALSRASGCWCTAATS